MLQQSPSSKSHSYLLLKSSQKPSNLHSSIQGLSNVLLVYATVELPEIH